MGDRVAKLKYLDPLLAVVEFPHRNFMRECTIRDGRAEPKLAGPLMNALDSFGFGLQRVPSCSAPLEDLRDPNRLDEVYTPVLMKWLQEQTGCAHAQKVNAVLRRSLPGRATAADRDQMSKNHFVIPGAWTGAIDGVHADYTDDSLLVHAARAIQAKRGLTGGRWIAVNVWRPVAGPVSCWPLAICDARSVDAAHLSPRETPENRNWVFNAHPEGDHEWWWFPQMTTDEQIVFKSWDEGAHVGTGPVLDRIRRSGQDVSVCVLHTGFPDSESPDDAPPRESLEVRALLFWPRVHADTVPKL